MRQGQLRQGPGEVGALPTAVGDAVRAAAEYGRRIADFQVTQHKIADMAANLFAMESIVELATEMSNRGGFDIRLEAAAAKEWNTCRAWEIVDDTMQIRGGRGYETASSLAARGEEPIAVERMMRDYRINKIFEGSSEIMHLFMAREAVDKHLEVAGSIIDPKKSPAEKVQALPRIAAFYASWYPTRWIPRARSFSEFGPFAGHLRFVERSTRRLSRQVFHGMVVHQARLQHKQAFLFRLVDIANELFAMAASVSRAHAMRRAGDPAAASAAELADLFCRGARRKVRRLFIDLWSNDDARKYRVAKGVLEGRQLWLEALIDGLDRSPEASAAAEEEPLAVAVH